MSLVSASVLVGGGNFVDACENFTIFIGECDSAASHGSGCYVEEFTQIHIAESCHGAAFAEAGYEGPGESGSMYVAAHTHYRGRVEGAVDGGLGVVGHHQSAELQTGAHE